MLITVFCPAHSVVIACGIVSALGRRDNMSVAIAKRGEVMLLQYVVLGFLPEVHIPSVVRH